MSGVLVRGARGFVRKRTEEPHVRPCGTNMGHPEQELIQDCGGTAATRRGGGREETAGPSTRLPDRAPTGSGQAGAGEMSAREERFLSAQADPFTGVKGEEKIGLLRSE
jgi:hypothetical protein